VNRGLQRIDPPLIERILGPGWEQVLAEPAAPEPPAGTAPAIDSETESRNNEG